MASERSGRADGASDSKGSGDTARKSVFPGCCGDGMLLQSIQMDGTHQSGSRDAPAGGRLGTRAVTRTPGDYPRLVGLDCAQGNLWGTTGEKHKYSQRQVE